MKRGFLWTGIGVVFLAVFNVLFFLLGGVVHPASVWISYGFIHFSYLMVLIAPFCSGKSREAIDFGFALTSRAFVYFVLELIVGLIFLWIRSESYGVALTVQVIMAGIFLILFLGNLISNSKTAEESERQRAEVFYVKNATSRVKMLLDRAPDSHANRALEQVYDLLNSSPTRSVPEAGQTEAEIMDRISALEDAVRRGSVVDIIGLCNELLDLGNERIRILKLAN